MSFIECKTSYVAMKIKNANKENKVSIYDQRKLFIRLSCHDAYQ